MTPDPIEVARVFTLPLARVCDGSLWEQREHRYHGNSVWAWHLSHEGEDIWGVTAMVLLGMADILGSAAEAKAD